VRQRLVPSLRRQIPEQLREHGRPAALPVTVGAPTLATVGAPTLATVGTPTLVTVGAPTLTAPFGRGKLASQRPSAQAALESGSRKRRAETACRSGSRKRSAKTECKNGVQKRSAKAACKSGEQQPPVHAVRTGGEYRPCANAVFLADKLSGWLGFLVFPSVCKHRVRRGRAQGVCNAQQTRIRAHCISQEIELVDILIDEGYSAKSLERPGNKRALAMLAAGRVEAIVVVKLDRLTRSVKDLGCLCDTYFREGQPSALLSVSDSIDTRSAGRKLLLNVLMSVAQWERDAISERTREALHELKRRGIRLGRAGYGWQWTKEPDATGRKQLIPHPEEQTAIRRISDLYRQGLGQDR